MTSQRDQGVSTDDGTQTEGTADDVVDGLISQHYPHVFHPHFNNNIGSEQSDGKDK
jgi:hypothetical protein